MSIHVHTQSHECTCKQTYLCTHMFCHSQCCQACLCANVLWHTHSLTDLPCALQLPLLPPFPSLGQVFFWNQWPRPGLAGCPGQEGGRVAPDRVMESREVTNKQTARLNTDSRSISWMSRDLFIFWRLSRADPRSFPSRVAVWTEPWCCGSGSLRADVYKCLSSLTGAGSPPRVGPVYFSA